MWCGYISPTCGKAHHAPGRHPDQRQLPGGADMIKRLPRKLIVACIVSLAIVLTVILGGRQSDVLSHRRGRHSGSVGRQRRLLFQES